MYRHNVMTVFIPFHSRDVAEMYDGILHKPLKLRPHITPAARAFLEALLQKDKTFRLGTGPRDHLDVKDHVFFRNINWDDLYNKRVEPPFNPNVSGENYVTVRSIHCMVM